MVEFGDKTLMVVKNGYDAELIRRVIAPLLTDSSALEILPAGAALVGRRYAKIVVVSLPEDGDSEAENYNRRAWLFDLKLKLPPGVEPIFAT